MLDDTILQPSQKKLLKKKDEQDLSKESFHSVNEGLDQSILPKDKEQAIAKVLQDI